jgi:DNA-binding NarL/FixJ family response regulator
MQYSVFDPPSSTRAENPVAMTINLGPSSGVISSAPLPEALPSDALVLTTAERNIALLVAEGARNHDIARQLGVSHRTVESHLSNIFAKLGIGSRVQLALWISGSARTDM